MEEDSTDGSGSACVGAIVIQYGASDIAALIDHLEGDPLVGRVVVVRNPRRGDPVDTAHDDAIHLPTNAGYAVAANVGRRAVATYPYHLVLTHDADLGRGMVAALVDAMQREPSIAIAGPQLQDVDHGSVTIGGERSAIGHVSHVTASRPLPPDAPPVRVTWIDGAVMLLRAAVVPPFDERFFLYVEDVALCLAVPPGSVAVVPAAIARQSSGMTARPGGHGYLLARNHLLMGRSRHERGAIVLGLVRGVRSTAAQLLRALTTSSRRHHLLQAVGTAWGTVDGLRGVTGPPPRRLVALGDIDLG